MELRFCCLYIWAGVLLQPSSSSSSSSAPEPAPRYLLQQAELSFDKANAGCSQGSLTTLRTQQEVQLVLQQVSMGGSGQRQMFWVGLKKVKSECVIQELPLRGFKWVVDGSEETQASRWLEEPKQTCALLCVALSLQLSGSNVTQWGLVPASCKNHYQSICKLTGTQELIPAVISSTPGSPTPTVPVSDPPEVHLGTDPPVRTSPNPTIASPEPKVTSPSPKEPEPSDTSKASVQNITDPAVLLKPATRSEGHDLNPRPGSRACPTPDINGSRSLTLDADDINRILLECWSGVELPLVCSGRPAVWRLLDNSTLNASSICRPCQSGFRKNWLGQCEDIDECHAGGAGCRHSCQNLDGSYRCVCLDRDGNPQDEDSPECAASRDQSWIMGILVPVLVAVALLLVLVVVVTVTVKCCLKRRSKRRAVKKAEKMAMRSKDTFETANETAA